VNVWLTGIGLIYWYLLSAWQECRGIGFPGENELPADCYVVARPTYAGHIGLSVVATDVGVEFLIRTWMVGFCYGHFW